MLGLTESLWLDEATTANVASNLTVAEIVTKFAPNDFHPPLYYVVMKFWVDLFGNSEIALRLPSVIFAALTVFVIFKMIGKVSAIVLATNPLFIYYAQEARMYSLVTLLVSCAVYLYTKKRWVPFSIVLMTLGLTDYVAFFLLPVFFLANPKYRRILVISLAPLVISYLWWGKYFLMQFQEGLGIVGTKWGQILGTLSIKNIFLIPVKFMIGRVGFDNKWLYGLVVISVASLFGYLIYRGRHASKIIWLWLIIPVFLGILISFRIPTLTYFRYLFALPAFCILVAKGIDKSKVFLSLILCVNLLFALYYVLNPRFHREDWRSAAKTIGENIIVTPKSGQTEALTYYGKGSQVIPVTELIKDDHSPIWLSRYVWEIFDPQDLTRQKVETLGFEKVGEYNFGNGLVFYRYEKE